MHYHLFTCSRCGAEERLRVDEYHTTEQAESFMLRDMEWQTVRYQFGRASFTEHRCPDCHAMPISMEEEGGITREPAESYA